MNLPSSIKANPSRGGDAKLWALNRPEGGTDKAARLPKGWTGPVSKSGRPGFLGGSPDFFARLLGHLNAITEGTFEPDNRGKSSYGISAIPNRGDGNFNKP